MTLETYLAYLATLTVFFLAPPGPSQILMISHSLRHGLGRSRATIAGDLSANALQMTAAAFGLAALVGTSQEVFTVVKWAGVAYLVYVGLRMWHAPAPQLGAPAAAVEAERRVSYRLYRQALLTSAANPQAVVFFAALFSPVHRPGHADRAAACSARRRLSRSGRAPAPALGRVRPTAHGAFRGPGAIPQPPVGWTDDRCGGTVGAQTGGETR